MVKEITFPLKTLASDPDAHRSLSDVVAFSDADFAGDYKAFHSTSGSSMFYKSFPICWKSSLQSIRTYRTCEAEYVGLFDTIRVVQGCGYRDWFDSSEMFPNVFGDNQSSIAIGRTSLATKKSEHFMLRYHLVRDFAKDLAFCPTDKNRANVFTKSTPRRECIELFGPPQDQEFYDREFSDSPCVMMALPVISPIVAPDANSLHSLDAECKRLINFLHF